MLILFLFQLDGKAFERIDKLINGVYQNTDLNGINYSFHAYFDDTKLDAAVAEKVFSEWYNTDDEYNYFFEPLKNTDGKYDLQHGMFIKIFMELLVIYHIKDRNMLTIYI